MTSENPTLKHSPDRSVTEALLRNPKLSAAVKGVREEVSTTLIVNEKAEWAERSQAWREAGYPDEFINDPANRDMIGSFDFTDKALLKELSVDGISPDTAMLVLEAHNEIGFPLPTREQLPILAFGVGQRGPLEYQKSIKKDGVQKVVKFWTEKREEVRSLDRVAS